MKAWRMMETGGPDVLQLCDVEKPVAGPGQVLIRVVAAGFNPIDTKLRAGIAAVAPESGILGCDVSGVVEAVGSGVTQFAIGDAVFGCAGGVKGMSGALAQYMATDARLLAKAPAALPLEECAALPIAALTAAEVLRRLAVPAGADLFIVGASGAVGLMTTQMATAAGCRVMGSAGNQDRIGRVHEFGGEGCLHAQAADMAAQGKRFPYVVDTFGGSGLQNALALAALNGHVATINARGQHELGQAHAKALTLHAIFILLPLLTGEGREQLGQALQVLATDIDAGRLRGLPVEKTGMSAVADVHARYERGDLPEKVVMLADF